MGQLSIYYRTSLHTPGHGVKELKRRTLCTPGHGVKELKRRTLHTPGHEVKELRRHTLHTPGHGVKELKRHRLCTAPVVHEAGTKQELYEDTYCTYTRTYMNKVSKNERKAAGTHTLHNHISLYEANDSQNKGRAIGTV